MEKDGSFQREFAAVIDATIRAERASADAMHATNFTGATSKARQLQQNAYRLQQEFLGNWREKAEG
jgi:hypothetical protein